MPKLDWADLARHSGVRLLHLETASHRLACSGSSTEVNTCRFGGSVGSSRQAGILGFKHRLDAGDPLMGRGVGIGQHFFQPAVVGECHFLLFQLLEHMQRRQESTAEP